MNYYFVIQGKLHGMNDIIGIARNNRYGSANAKKQQMDIVSSGAYSFGLHKVKIEKKIDVEISFYEPNSRRDPDNIVSGMKFIFDALVNMGVIKDDSQKYIGKILLSEIMVDKENPRIEVRLIERD